MTPPARDASARVTAAFALALSVFSWAQAPVFIRFLRNDYDAISMAFIRYGSGTVALILVCLVFHRAEFWSLFRRPRPVLGIAALNVFQQWAWTAGCAGEGAGATMAAVIAKLDVVFVIIFSYFLFREERGVIRSPMFLVGTALSFAGVAAVLLKEPGSYLPVFDTSSSLLLITAISWAVYRVWSKHIVMTIHPVPMFAVLAIYTTLGFAVLMFPLGEPRSLLTAGPRITAIALFSGLMPIAVAHPAFNLAQKHLGAAFSTAMGLLTPLFSYLLALLLLPDEVMQPAQWAGAAILIAGSFLVVWAGRRVHGGAAVPVVAPGTEDSPPPLSG